MCKIDPSCAYLDFVKSFSNRLFDRVTALDRSSEPFFCQLAEAFDIVSVPQDAFNHAETKVGEAPTKSGPKEEWVLRWLLKKLDATEVLTGCPVLHFRAWHLLKVLIARVSTKIVARMLIGNGFIAIVQATLEWLRSNWDSMVISSKENGKQPLVGFGAESKKRKRQEAESREFLEVGSDATRLFVSVLSTIRQIETKASEALTAEHLNLCLRSKPVDAARMLGSCLEIVKFSSSNTSSQILHSDLCEIMLQPSFRLWDSRFASAEDDLGLSDIVRLSLLFVSDH